MAASIVVGEVYWMPSPKYYKEHFHVVIVKANDHSGLILCVPLNTYDSLERRMQDNACILDQREIPDLLTRKTQVTYKNSWIIEENYLLEMISDGRAKQRTTVNRSVLEKIQVKLPDSRKVPFEVIDFYLQHRMFFDLENDQSETET